MREEASLQATIDRAAARHALRQTATRRAFSWGAMLEISIALLLLLFLAPWMIVVALIVHLQDSGPIFFAHRRIGMDGRPFNVLKFRTMVVDAEVRLQRHLATDPEARRDWLLYHKLREDPRITAIGGFLRKSSIDELPQLINVVRRDMSFIGPRPIVAAEIAKYGRFYREYCSVRPGITGLWQVSGRNDTSYRRRVAMDVLYSRRASPMLNVQLALLTVPAVLRWKGSY